MKLKSGVIITKAQGGFVAVDAGAGEGRFNGMVKMNKTAAFIAELLKDGADENVLVKKLLKKYDATEDAARQSVADVISNLRKAGLIEDE